MISFNIIKNDYKITKAAVNELELKLKNRGWAQDKENPKYVFIFGGDGTFLKTVSTYKEKIRNMVLVPFKMGGVGFYTNKNSIENIDKVIESIEKENFIINKFELLNIKSKSKNFIACNEVKILNERQPIYVEIFINGKFLERFHGTGLVVSTSNGSTGYMKSAGGAVIFPNNRNIYQIQELVPLSTNKYRTLNAPLILDETDKLRFRFEKDSKEFLIVDTVEYLIEDEEIEIYPLEWKVNVLAENEFDSKIELLRNIFIKDKEIIE